MKFKPKFHRIQATTRSDARLMARAAVDKLTVAQVTQMERELKITAASIKNLNPRMCFKVIAWVETTVEFEKVKNQTLRGLDFKPDR